MTIKRQTHTAHHPGKLLAEELQERDISQRELARRIGRPYQVVNDICRGVKSITPATAIELEEVLDGISADFWLRLQMAHDLALARTQRQSQLA